MNAEKIYDKVRKEKVFSVQKLRKSHGSKIKYNNRLREIDWENVRLKQPKFVDHVKKTKLFLKRAKG